MLKGVKYSFELMMENMIEQMNNWKNAKVNYPIIFVKYETIHKYINQIEKILGVKFTIPFRERKTDENMIKKHMNIYKLHKHKDIIEKARETYRNMPEYLVKK